MNPGREDQVPVALLNVSDWRAAEAAVSDPPCALDSALPQRRPSSLLLGEQEMRAAPL